MGTSIDVNNPLVASHTLFNNDIVLLKKLFHHGLDPNIYNNLYNCRSLQAAQLFLIHGADFNKQHKRYGLIDYQCGFGGGYHDSSVLALFLPHVPLDKSNQFGKKWFSSLIKEQRFFAMEAFIERIAILLQYGCHYDQEQANRIITARDPKARTPDQRYYKNQRYYKIRTSQLFKQAETSRKNVVFGLHQRALTGKPFGFKRTPQI